MNILNLSGKNPNSKSSIRVGECLSLNAEGKLMKQKQQ